MRADEVLLQFAQLVWRDDHRREVAEPRVDTVCSLCESGIHDEDKATYKASAQQISMRGERRYVTMTIYYDQQAEVDVNQWTRKHNRTQYGSLKKRDVASLGLT